MLFTAVLCLSGIGVAAAEPPELQKNQILVVAKCPPPAGPSYTFVINGMSKTGHVTSSTDADVSENANIVVKQFTVEYFQGGPEPIDGDEYVNPVTESGNKKGFKGDLIQCSGVAKNIELEGLGTVTAKYEFQAFVTPRGGA
jgi:hypothetical protein